jgi:hypothetical protein
MHDRGINAFSELAVYRSPQKGRIHSHAFNIIKTQLLLEQYCDLFLCDLSK